MTPEQKLPDLLHREAVAPKRFDPRSAALLQKPVSICNVTPCNLTPSVGS
jgi:hypothetical protein